jgi:hypothetical protein
VRGRLDELARALGAEADTQQDIDVRILALQQANAEIARLKSLLSQKEPLEGLGCKLRDLGQQVYEWWKSLGFGFCEGSFKPSYDGSGYYQVRFTCYLDVSVSSLFEDKPVTAKRNRRLKIEQLGSQVDLLHADSGREVHFLDTSGNRAFLLKVLRQRFGPDAYLCTLATTVMGEEYCLRELLVNIPITSIPAAEHSANELSETHPEIVQSREASHVG